MFVQRRKTRQVCTIQQIGAVHKLHNALYVFLKLSYPTPRNVIVTLGDFLDFDPLRYDFRKATTHTPHALLSARMLPYTHAYMCVRTHTLATRTGYVYAWSIHSVHAYLLTRYVHAYLLTRTHTRIRTPTHATQC